jgi:hypothetical protein
MEMKNTRRLMLCPLLVDIGGEEGSAEFRFQSDDSLLSFFLILFRRILHELDNIQFG